MEANGVATTKSQASRRYSVYGRRLSSNIPLPELRPARFRRNGMVVEWIPSNAPPCLLSESAKLLRRLSTTAGVYLSMYEDRECILLRWEGRHDFEVTKDGLRIRCQSAPGIGAGAMAGTLYGAVLSFALHLQGISNFHSSAVVLPGGAVGLMATPGSGKSTLAAAFSRRGYSFLTDDVLPVGKKSSRYVAYPGAPYIALSGDSLNGLTGSTPETTRIPNNEVKRRFTVTRAWAGSSREPVSLRGMFILNRITDGTAIATQRLTMFEAFRSLLDHTNCLSLLPADVLERHVGFVGGLAQSVPVWRLDYPTGFDYIPEVIEELVSLTGEAISQP